MAMNYNPYAAPAGDALRARFSGEPGAPQPWGVGEVIDAGWEAVKRDWPVLVFAPLVAMIISEIPSAIYGALVAAGMLHDVVTYTIANIAFTLLGFLVSWFFLVGQLRIFSAAARGESPEFGMLFGGGDRFLPMLGTQLLFVLVVALGMVALVVPGVIALLGLSLAQYYCAEASLGPIESLKASWEATKGHKGSIFLLVLAAGGVIIVGMLALCVGIFVAMPVVGVAMATAYLRMSGRGGASLAPMPGFGPPPGMPPGHSGFGAPLGPR